MKYFYQSIVNPGTYDKKIRPNQAISPVNVSVSLYVLRVGEFDETNSNLKVSMYFRQQWLDQRLSHRSDGPLKGGPELVDLIWKPDTFFVNSLGGDLGSAVNSFARIDPDGTVLYSAKVNPKIYCEHRASKFPLDKIGCLLEIESYGSTAQDLEYNWKRNGIAMGEDLGLTQFTVSRRFMNSSRIEKLPTGNYSRISFQFKATRNGFPFLLKYFVPLILTSVLCLIPITDNRLRSKTALTSFTLTGILVVILNIHICPKAGVVTAFDAFGLICILFTTIVLLLNLRRNGSSDGEVSKLSDREERLHQHAFKILPIAYASFLLFYLLAIVILSIK